MSDRLKGKRALVPPRGGIGCMRMHSRGRANVFATDIRRGKPPVKEGIADGRLSFARRRRRRLGQAGGRRHPAQCGGFVHHGTSDCGEDWDFSFDLNVNRCIARSRVLPACWKVARTSSTSPRRGVEAAPSYVLARPRPRSGAAKRCGGLHHQGIRCNCICPGTIETPSMLHRRRRGPGRKRCSSTAEWDG